MSSTKNLNSNHKHYSGFAIVHTVSVIRSHVLMACSVIAHLNDIEGHKGTIGVHHSHVDMKVSSQTREEYESKEDQKERYLGPIE